MTFQPTYTPRFDKHVQTFQNLRARIEKVVLQIIADPYARTEQLTYKQGFNLKGCRSAHVDATFASFSSFARSVEKNPTVSIATVKVCQIKPSSSSMKKRTR